MRKLFQPGNIGTEGISCIVAAGIVFLGFCYGGNSVHNIDGQLWGTSAYNYIVYILTIIAAMSGYCCTAFLLTIKPVKRSMQFVCYPIYMLFLLASFYFLWNVYKNEATEYAGYELHVYSIRENVQHWAFALLMGIIMAGCICILRNMKFRKDYLRWIVMCSAALINAMLTFAPNTFLNAHWGLYHTHAYENTIVNIARLQPFTELNRSIYGHYALLYLPFVKLFGNNMMGVACAISIFTFVTFLCSFYIAHKTIKSDGTFVAVIMAIASIGTLTYGGGQYFQVLPQRLIVQTIVLAYIAYKDTVLKPLSNIKTIILDLLLSAFAFTMGIEGGNNFRSFTYLSLSNGKKNA